MSGLDLVMARQMSWATRNGLSPDPQGYLPTIRENLFAPLSALTDMEFQAGAGNEITDRPGEPAKMRALHSSSALVCNIFDYWRSTDPAAIGRALGLPHSVTELHFEAQLPTGLRGTPPTLDLLLVVSDSVAWGVESKFTEPFQPNAERARFAESYFEDDAGMWTRLGLQRCQRLAEQLSRGRIQFHHLDAAQLLKHALGIRRKYSKGKLLLLWYDVDTPEARTFADEIRVFAHSIDEDLGFRAVTHQEVFARLSSEPGAAPAYVAYVGSRYFPL